MTAHWVSCWYYSGQGVRIHWSCSTRKWEGLQFPREGCRRSCRGWQVSLFLNQKAEWHKNNFINLLHSTFALNFLSCLLLNNQPQEGNLHADVLLSGSEASYRMSPSEHISGSRKICLLPRSILYWFCYVFLSGRLFMFPERKQGVIARKLNEDAEWEICNQDTGVLLPRKSSGIC